MPIVCGVKFRGTGKIYYFSPGDVTDLQGNDHVIVETARGVEMGQVTMSSHEVPESEIVGQLKAIMRRATPSDLLDAQRFRGEEAGAVARCKEQVNQFKLPMKIVDAEYNYDGSRLTFFFTSEQRVDFRELVRELAHIFRTRIELRQIGVRDEAKLMGGLGRCGRPLCCATWLTEFCPVSIRMAKQQDLPLSPMEISGLCGRLLCCLGYENDYYQEVKGRFPKVGKLITTPLGTGKVIKVSALRETVNILMDDGSTFELTAGQVEGKEPLENAPESSDAAPQAAFDTALDELTEPEEAAPARAGGGEHRVVEARPQPPARHFEQDTGGRNNRPRHRPELRDAETPGKAEAPASAPAGKPKEGAEQGRPEGAPSQRPPRRRSHHPRPARTPAEGEEQHPGGSQSPKAEATPSAGAERRNPRRRRRHGGQHREGSQGGAASGEPSSAPGEGRGPAEA